MSATRQKNHKPQSGYKRYFASTSNLAPAATLAVLIGVTGLLSGCGTISAVKDSDRDTSGKYDGRWMATFQRTPSKQLLPSNWTFTCPDRKGTTIGFSIDDGVVASGFASKKLVRTNINKSGEFRLEVPSAYSATASGTSDLSINNGDITLIMQGNLGKKTPSGYFVAGVAEFGNQGCTTKLLFKRVSS